MTKLSNLLCFIVLLLAANVRGAAFLEGGGSGGAPNVNIVSPGVNVASITINNDSVYQFGDGTYTPGTPSILQSNLMTRTAFGGILLAAKTNIEFRSVQGTVFDGRNGLGELLILSNCSRITIDGGEWKGHTNYNWANLPGYSPVTTNAGAYLWGSIALMATCEHITFKNMWVNGSADHGIWDYAASQGALFPNADTPSTNNIQILDSRFSYIGGWRTNSTTPTTAIPAADGTAIVPPGGGWRMSRLHFDNNLRGIEPYDESDAGGKLGYGHIITDCTFDTHLLFAVGPAGSTNAHSVQLSNLRIINPRTFNFRGTNFGGGSDTDVSGIGTYGLYLNGGRGWRVSNVEIAGLWSAGIWVGNSLSGCDDYIFDNILIRDIITGSAGSGVGIQVGDVTADTGAAGGSVKRAIFTNIKAQNIAAKGYRITSCRDCTFDGIEGWNAGVYSTASSGTFAALSLGEDAYTSNTPTNVHLRNLKFYSGQNGAGAQAYAVFVSANAYSSQIENWHLVGQAENGGITNKSGANVTVSGPARTFYATIDLPSIGVNSQFTTSFTATGATTNDAVEMLRIPAQFYASGNTTNVQYNAWCSNNLIYVKFSNNDAVTAADAPSVRMVATIRQVQVHGQ